MSILYLFLGLIYGLIIALSILVVVGLFYIFPFKYYRPIRRAWGRFVLGVCGIRVELHGRFDERAQLLVINHSSILDIIALEALHPADLCWMAKKEISQIPIFGQIIKKPKMISINRSNAREFLQNIKQAKERVQEGRVLAIFPEGTRADGIQLARFKKGASMLSEKLNLHTQAVVIAGSRRAINSKGGLSVRPFSKVIIKALDMQCESLEQLHSHMQAELDTLNDVLEIKAQNPADKKADSRINKSPTTSEQ